MEHEGIRRGSGERVEEIFGTKMIDDIRKVGKTAREVVEERIKDAIAQIAEGEGTPNERYMRAERCLEGWKAFLKNLGEKGADENIASPEIK